MVLDVYAGGLAVLDAQVAVYALCLVYGRAEQGESGNGSQYGSDRADGVAVGPAVTPCEDKQYHQRGGCNYECRQ